MRRGGRARALPALPQLYHESPHSASMDTLVLALSIVAVVLAAAAFALALKNYLSVRRDKK